MCSFVHLGFGNVWDKMIALTIVTPVHDIKKITFLIFVNVNVFGSTLVYELIPSESFVFIRSSRV